jgi:hypothetical protein
LVLLFILKKNILLDHCIQLIQCSDRVMVFNATFNNISVAYHQYGVGSRPAL